MQIWMARQCTAGKQHSLTASWARWASAGAHFTLIALTLTALAACQSQQPAQSSPREPLLFYDWTDELPPTIFDAFEAETGIPVQYVPYEATEEAVANLRAGQRYDVVVMDNSYIQPLAEAGLLAELDRQQLPNFKNVAPGFRGLVFDPQNRYSVPYSWGITGLVVRPDLAAGLVDHPVTRWSDLWDPALAGKVAIWRDTPREGIGMALKSLGYSANSEDPVELAAAQARLLELRTLVHFGEEWGTYTMVPAMMDGGTVVAGGYAYDARNLHDLDQPAEFVLPEEGALLWGDNFIVPAASQRQADAMRLLNYLLRPEIGAQIVEYTYIQLANDAAVAALPDALRNDPLLFVPAAQLRNAEILLPLSPAGEALYEQVWQTFLDADGIGKVAGE